MTAIIIVDLQNDFLTVDGPLKQNHIPTYFLKNIEELVKKERNIGSLIIWINSIYHNNYIDHKDKFNYYQDELNKLPFNYDVLFKTHCGKRQFCAKDTLGQKFHIFASELIIDSDIIITKNNYSSFIDTNLKNILDANNIKKTIVCGVTTNNCVKATAIHSYLLGFDTYISKSCTMSTNEIKKDKTLKELENICTIID